MAYKINVRGTSDWENLLKDANIEVTDPNGNFTSPTLDGVLDELHDNSGGGGSSLSWSVITTNTTADKDNGYFVDTSSGEVTLTLPTSASVGDTLSVTDVNGNLGSNKCIVARNGHKIMGLEEDFDCDFDNCSINLTYSGTTEGWRIVYSATTNSSGAGGGGGLVTEVVSIDTTCVSSIGYMVDTITADADVTMTLPTSPTVGDQIGFTKVGDTYNIIIVRSGELIQGIDEDLTLDGNNQSCVLDYGGVTLGWRVKFTSPISSTTPIDVARPARKNLLINGNLKVAQRGTSYVTTGQYCCIDNWFLRYQAGVGGTVTGGQVIGSELATFRTNYLKMNFTGATSSWYMIQYIEDARSCDAGRTYTMSWSSYFDEEASIRVQIDIQPDDGATTDTRVLDDIITVEAGHQNMTHTFTVPSNVSVGTDAPNGRVKVGIYLGDQSSIIDGSYRFAELQIEEGSEATTLESRSYGEELALCQRYYLHQVRIRLGGYVVNQYTYGSSSYPVTMRTSPTVLNVTLGTTQNGTVSSYGIYNCDKSTFTGYGRWSALATGTFLEVHADMDAGIY